MNKEEALQIIEKINEDAELTAKIAETSSVEELVELLKSNGYDVTADDINNIGTILEIGDTELDEGQLDKVVGGNGPGYYKWKYGYRK